MITIYGLKTCPYCDYVKAQIEGREDEFRYIDIGTNVRYMHEFISLRDHRSEFDHSKEIGDIGIPAFVFEDGTITLDPAKAGLKEYDPSQPSCSIDDHRKGKKGC
ncbi:MAG: glutaredoxin domain-containing protein [Candidatus Weimeria sp.]